MALRQFNSVSYRGGVVTMQLTDRDGNKVGETVFDFADLQKVRRLGKRWSMIRKETEGLFYVRCRHNGQNLYLHNLIASPGDGLIADHIDGDGLNNRRSNLRCVTYSKNQRNHRVREGKNITWDSARRKWQVRIRVGGKTRHIGRYDTLAAASDALAAALPEIVAARLAA